MKNEIKYYYNLNPIEIHQIDKKYKFKTIDKTYIMYPYTRNYNELEDIYKLHHYIRAIGHYCHKIILNNNNNIVTPINKMPYILLQIEIENRNINKNDILNFSKIKINSKTFKKIERNIWYNLWQKKMDYIEYQINQFGKKYPIIRESSDYYIGIVENCISLLSSINENNTYKAIGHERVEKKTKTDEFYNPINLIIDHRCRDIGEYMKSINISKIDLEKTIYDIIKENNYNIEDTQLLFIRLIYPSNYIDTCEKILEKKELEEKLIEITKNINNYEEYIRKVYSFFSTIVPLQDIEWMKKN